MKRQKIGRKWIWKRRLTAVRWWWLVPKIRISVRFLNHFATTSDEMPATNTVDAARVLAVIKPIFILSLFSLASKKLRSLGMLSGPWRRSGVDQIFMLSATGVVLCFWWLCYGRTCSQRHDLSAQRSSSRRYITDRIYSLHSHCMSTTHNDPF